MQSQLTRRQVLASRPKAFSSAVPRVAAPCQQKLVCRVARPSVEETLPDSVDFDELSQIIRLVNATDIVEMEWKGKRFNLSVKKSEALKAAEPVYQVISQPQYAPAPAGYAPPPPAAAPAPAAAAPAAAPAAPKPAAPAPAAGGIELQSPMAGTFYASAAPGEPAFVKVGDKVKKGQTVGIIEAMKLMNEIEAEVSGEVVKVTVENGKPISAGQPMMVIRP